MASRSRARSSASKGTGPRGAPPRRRAPARAGLLDHPWARALASHPDRTAAGFFALVVLVYLWPVLVGGKILSPNSLLYGVAPWQRLAPSDVNSYANGLLSDIPFADYPWRAFARELIRSGTLPAWNPHVFAGIPFMSNPQTGIYSIFSVPLWVLPFNYAIGVEAALKLWVGGFGSYLLVRQLRLGFLPGLLAGVTFMFCSLNIVWLTHETLPAVAVLLPWMLWLVERIFERGRLGTALWLAVVCAAALGGGHPGMQVHVVAVTALYAVVRGAIVWREAAGRDAWLRPLALTGGGLALGLALMAAMLIPEALSSHGTLGTIARQGGHGTIPGSSMPFSATRTVIFPDWWGRPSAVGATDAPRTSISATAAVEVNYNERTFYAGVVALLLAIVALATRDGWRRKAPFAVLMFIGLAIPLHMPGPYTLLEHLPVFKLVQNQRLHFAFELATAVLAAFGLQALLDRPAGERRARLAVPAAALLLGLVVLALVGPSGKDLERLARHFATGRDFQSNHVLALTAVTWFLLFAVATGAVLLLVRRRPAWGRWAAVALVALALADMLHFAHGYQPMGPESKVIPPTTPSIDFLRAHAREGRFVGAEYALPQDWSLLYGLNDARGYDPPQPTLRLYRLWLRANPEQGDWEPFEITSLRPQAMRVMSVLGARYAVVAPGTPPPHGSDPATVALRRVYSGEDADVYANAQAAPRAMVAPAVQVVAGEAGARAAIETPGFDAARTAVVERDEPGVAALAGAHGSAAVVHESNAAVTVRASLDRRGLVVLDDGFTDGWSVRIDGHVAPMLHVDDVVRGVVVPAGTHTVEWSFSVPGLGLGAALSGLSLLLLLAGAGLARRRGARQGL